MLHVASRDFWEDYFRQSSITNCNIWIFHDLNALFTKADISKFSYSGYGSRSSLTLPTEEASFTITNWDKYQQNKYAFAVDSVLWVEYVVEGTNTGDKCFVVQEIKENHRQKTVDVRCKSFLESLTSVPSVVLGTQVSGDIVRLPDKDIMDNLILNVTMPVSIHKWYASNSVLSSMQTISSPKKYQIRQISIADMLNQMALGYSCGIQVSRYDTAKVDLYFKDCGDFSVDGNFDEMNLFDYDFEVDINIPKPIKITDLPTGEREEFSVGAGTTTTIEFDKNKFNFSVYPTNNWTVFNVTNKSMTIKCSQSYTYWWYDDPNISSLAQEGETVAFSYVVGSMKRYNEFTSYVSKNQLVTCNCRIDPTFEPMDIIETTIEGTKYKICLEEVHIDFNGGYMGSIKGRILGASLQDPIIKNLDIANGTFDIVNPNPIDVDANIQYSNGTFTLQVLALSTLHCDIASNVSPLAESFQEKNYGTLIDDVVCWFSEAGYDDSDNAIILEKD